MVRQTSDEGSENAAGISRTTILLLAGFMAGMTAGVSPSYALFCLAVATLSIVAYLALELAAARRAREDELSQAGEESRPSEGWSRREQRRSFRYAVPPEQQEATLKVGQAKMPVRLLNVSAGGFRVHSARDPGVEVGQVVWIRTDAGWDEVRVVEAVLEGEAYRVRLQICSAAKPWNHLRDGQSRQPRSRVLARLPVVCGVLVAIGVALAPLVRNAFLNDSVPAVSVSGQSRTKGADEVEKAQPGVARSVRSSTGSARVDPGFGTMSPGSTSGKRHAVNQTHPSQDNDKPTGLVQQGTDERSRPDDSSGMVGSNLTDAINTILRDVVEPTTDPPLVVQRQQDDPSSARAVPERAAGSGSSRLRSGSGRDRSKALASFDHGLRSFWRSQYAEAVVAFGEAIEDRPDNPTYHYFLALSHYLAGQRKRAEESLSTAVELEAEYPSPELGRLLQRVQGPHRRWMQAARIKAQVGPYRPRR